MLNIDNGADEVCSRLFICGTTDNIGPELLTLLTCPAIGTLVDRDDKLLFPVKEGKKLALLRFHNFSPDYEDSAATLLLHKDEVSCRIARYRFCLSIDTHIVSF